MTDTDRCPPAADMRLLLVEPRDRDATWLEALLERPGLSLRRARKLRDVLACLDDWPFDLCLLEPDLPGSQGFEIIRLIRDRRPDVPVVAVSRRLDRGFDVDLMELGVSVLLDKTRLDAGGLERHLRYARARSRESDRLAQAVHYDDLTGLANRALFQDRLQRALAFGRRNHRLVGVLILDLNGFKAVNDALGHGGGDLLLRRVGERLTMRLRESDTVARLGGDEFAILLENLAKADHAHLVATKLLDAVAPPMPVLGREVAVTASIGIALWPADAQQPDELMALADRAMYRAKQAGGNRCRFASDDLERATAEGATLKDDLQRALDCREFGVLYQPQVNLVPGRTVIAALPRWRHPDRGTFGLEQVLGLADQTGLLPELTGWLIDTAVDQASAWRAGGASGFSIALPFGVPQQLRWAELAPRLHERLDRAAVPADALEIELGEDLLASQAEIGGRPVKRLKAIGVRVGLDRFGVGPTSLRILETEGLDGLKISPELVQGVVEDGIEAAMVEAMTGVGRHLGLRIVAEGVATSAQVDRLRRQGCHAVQAFVRCPPLSPEACTGWLLKAARRRDPAPSTRRSRAGKGSGRGT